MWLWLAQQIHLSLVQCRRTKTNSIIKLIKHLLPKSLNRQKTRLTIVESTQPTPTLARTQPTKMRKNRISEDTERANSWFKSTNRISTWSSTRLKSTSIRKRAVAQCSLSRPKRETQGGSLKTALSTTLKANCRAWGRRTPSTWRNRRRGLCRIGKSIWLRTIRLGPMGIPVILLISMAVRIRPRLSQGLRAITIKGEVKILGVLIGWNMKKKAKTIGGTKTSMSTSKVTTWSTPRKVTIGKLELQALVRQAHSLE